MSKTTWHTYQLPIRVESDTWIILHILNIPYHINLRGDFLADWERLPCPLGIDIGRAGLGPSPVFDVDASCPSVY